MSNIDGPDYQRATVASEGEEGTFGSGIVSTVVDVTPGQKALWIFGEGIIDPLPTVTGQTTGYEYPVFWAPWQSQAQLDWFSVVCILTGAFDSAVRIQWSAAPSNLWWVVADNGERFGLDIALANTINGNGQPAPGVGVTIAGSDGTDTRILATDSSGKLLLAGSTNPSVGPTGSPVPADATLIGGSDGTDLVAVAVALGTGRLLVQDTDIEAALQNPGSPIPTNGILALGSDGTDARPPLVDSSGRLLTIDQILKLAIAANGGAVPADVVLVGGTDGIDIHAVKIDSGGNLVVRDVVLETAVGPTGFPVPADAMQVGGTDGTDLRTISVDASGHQLTIDQNLKLAIAAQAAAVPADVVQVGGSDGTDLRAERVTTQGVQYATPVAPSTVTGDRPPVEITVASISATTPLASPGASHRLRVFRVQPVLGVAGNAGTVTWQPNGFGAPQTMLGFGGATGPYVREGIDMPLSGLLMAANTGITWNDVTGTNGAVIFYTIETV